jgi:hypothetical protein
VAGGITTATEPDAAERKGLRPPRGPRLLKGLRPTASEATSSGWPRRRHGGQCQRREDLDYGASQSAKAQLQAGETLGKAAELQTSSAREWSAPAEQKLHEGVPNSVAKFRRCGQSPANQLSQTARQEAFGGDRG